MTNTRKLFLKFFLIFVTIACLIFFMTLILFYRPIPSSSKMESYFKKHGEVFLSVNNQIMAIIDKKGSLTPTEQEEFTKKLDVEFFEITGRPVTEVKYMTHKRGIGLGLFGSGIAYRSSPPERIYRNYEEMNEEAFKTEGFVGYISLDDFWYIIYWEID